MLSRDKGPVPTVPFYDMIIKLFAYTNIDVYPS